MSLIDFVMNYLILRYYFKDQTPLNFLKSFKWWQDSNGQVVGNLIEDQTEMKIPSEINLFFKVFHIMECINFAFPFHDWDHEGGDGRQHYLR